MLPVFLREGRTNKSIFRRDPLASFDAVWKEVPQIKTLFIVGQVTMTRLIAFPLEGR